MGLIKYSGLGKEITLAEMQLCEGRKCSTLSLPFLLVYADQCILSTDFLSVYGMVYYNSARATNKYRRRPRALTR